MNTDIYIIESFRIAQILFKVFHIGDQQVLITFEIFVHLFIFITDMNNDLSATDSD
jgi:hypothetical protein